MSFEGRAFYNLLRMGEVEEYAEEIKPWQILDYRELSISKLFTALRKEGPHLDQETFLLYVEKCSSPEEITEVLLADEEDEEKFEKIYLLIFELWRRLCKDKVSLSVFCDELDYQIERYDQEDNNEELLQEMLTQLENLLDQNVDRGEDLKSIFKVISDFLAHDLEDFIYDFAAAYLDAGNDVYASELIDGFYDYFEETSWLDLLKARLLAQVDPEEATLMISRLVEQLQENPDLDLFFEILRYLVYEEKIPLFYTVFELIEPLLEREEDFQDLLEIMADYFSSLDKEEEERKIRDILEKRKTIDKEREFMMQDGDFQELKKMISATSL
jgi:hypothetical protein